MSIRLAIVQYGDYAEALRLIREGVPERYFGQASSVEVTERLLGDREALVVSIGAPSYRVPHRNALLVGLPMPKLPKMSKAVHSWRIAREVRAFRPTHLLLRSGGLIAWPLLRYAVARRINTLIMAAGYVRDVTWRERLLNRDLARLMNDPTVFLVGNHRVPAAESLLAAGVLQEKVVAFDWQGQPNPGNWPVKAAPRGDGPRLVAYVGGMAPGKGVGDLLDAIIVLARNGQPTRLTACGDGPALAALREKARRELGDLAEFPGRLSNAEVARVMAQADLVCVPSRRESSEGLPLVATEALAVRTPLIASDHPSLTHLLRDGEGVRFFRSGDPVCLAGVIREVLADPVGYARLSEGTAAAYARLECKTDFVEILDRWAASW